MGAYDTIQDPVQGQPISSSQFGARVKAAIQDLDRRISAYDATTGVGKVMSTANLVISTTTETAALTLTGFTFRAGYAYKATYRSGFLAAASTTQAGFRLRKYNATPASGADWGEYFRFQAGSTPSNVMNAFGTLYLLNATGTNVTSDVNLIAFSTAAGASALTIWASAASPRYLVIEPAGFAADYVGMGVQVT
jgi:hypothetical protein